MDLRDYLRVLRRGWAVVLAFVVVGTGIGVLLTVVTKTEYQADVQIFVSSSSTDTSTLNGGNTFTQDRVQTYTALAKSPNIANSVKTSLKLGRSQQEIIDAISADAPQSRSLIDLHVVDRDPSQAARIANATAQFFDTFVARSEQKDASGKSVVTLTVFVPATIPKTPVTPHKVINIGLGFLIGLLLGVGLVVLRAVLDTTMKSPEDFEAVGLPLLGFVPLDKRASRSPVAFRADPHSARSESYRSIRTNMQFVDVDNPPRLIAVTSAMPGEGKTTTAINLAAALAEAGYRVCLVDADLRRPSIAATLGLVGDVGFTTVLISDTPVEDVLQNAGRNLAVLTSGPIPPNPSELLLSAHARSVIQQLADKVDFVVIDTPPLLPVTDAAELATVVDATLLVARFGKTTREQAARSVGALAKVGERPVGVIVNMVSQTRGTYDYQYGYYYAPYRPDRKRRDDGTADKAGKAEKAANAEAGDAEKAGRGPPAGRNRDKNVPATPGTPGDAVTVDADSPVGVDADSGTSVDAATALDGATTADASTTAAAERPDPFAGPDAEVVAPDEVGSRGR